MTHVPLQAGGQGGAVHVTTNNGLVISNFTSISNNTAVSGGGVYFTSKGLSYLFINSSTIEHNTAQVRVALLLRTPYCDCFCWDRNA